MSVREDYNWFKIEKKKEKNLLYIEHRNIESQNKKKDNDMIQ